MVPTLNKKSQHFQGFDGLRLIAAVSVMFSHAFLLGTGSEEREPFVRLLGPKNIMGLYGVFIFFIISGFLLTRSLASNPSAITYTVNRILRILPAFLCCTLLMALLIGPMASSKPAGQYFSSPELMNFVSLSLDSFGDAPLPGVYNYDGGKLAQDVNGSLWSLRYEALSYVFLLMLWTFLRRLGPLTAVIVTASLLTWASPYFALKIAGIAYTLPYFSGGVLMCWIHRRFGTNLRGVIASLLLLGVAVYFHVQSYAFALLGAYLVIYLGERANFGSKIAEKLGDCSYGLYLYGWPAEQIVKQVTKTQDPLWLFMLALPLAFVFALISCHLVEKPAMARRVAVAKWLRAAIDTLLDASKGARRHAILGAKIAFGAATIFILQTAKHWWYFFESMVDITLFVIAGSLFSVALYHASGMLGLRRPSALRSRS